MSHLFADVIWPAALLEGRLLTWWAIGAGLVIEYGFLLYLTDLSAKRAALADVAMNAISALAGLFLIPLSGIAWEFFPGLFMYKVFEIGTFNPITWAATFLMACTITTMIEFYVLRKLFKQQLGARGFWVLLGANAISVGLAFGSLFAIPPRL